MAEPCIIDPNLDPIQNNCKYGWVLPDRCRYNPLLGCDCGAYPAWSKEQREAFIKRREKDKERPVSSE